MGGRDLQGRFGTNAHIVTVCLRTQLLERGQDMGQMKGALLHLGALMIVGACMHFCTTNPVCAYVC